MSGGPVHGGERVLTRDALEFVAGLTRRFGGGVSPARPPPRAPAPPRRRRASELPARDRRRPRGDVDRRARRPRPRRPAGGDHRAGRRKMMINALNSGAKVFMADFEDALSPTWENVVDGQANCMDAVRAHARLHQPRGKAVPARATSRRHARRAAARLAPRGAPRRCVDGAPMSASLFDFGLYFYHNARELIARGSGPVLLPAEAGEPPRGAALERVFVAAQERARASPRHDPRHRPDRDDPGRVRDGRDPLRAARPRRGAQRRPLGLHLQHHQEVPRAGPSSSCPTGRR